MNFSDTVRKCLWLSLGLVAIVSQLSAATLTWPEGTTGHWQTDSIWGGSTFGATDFARVSNGNVTLTSGNVVPTSGWVYLGDTAGSNTTLSMTSANLTAVRFYAGNSGAANINATSSHIGHGQADLFQVGVTSTGHGNISLLNSTLTTNASKDIDIGLSGNGFISSSNSTLNIGRYYAARNSGSEGHLTLSDNSNMNATIIYVGYSGHGNLTINNSNLVSGSLSISHQVGSSGNFIFNSGNVTVGTLAADRIYINNDGALLRLGGGSANLTTTRLGVSATNHTWEHLIDRRVGRYDQMGMVYITIQPTAPSGHVKIGVKGGAVFSKTSSFYLQVATSNGALGYASTPSSMYDAPVLVTGMDGTKDAVQTTLTAGNQLASLDVTNVANISHTLANSQSAGWVSVANVDPSVQTLGIDVFFQLATGTASDVVAKLVAAGYSAQEISYEGYNLKFTVPVSDLTAGTGYVIFDFRDISTAVAYATVSKLMVTPVVSGATFYIH